MSLCIQIDHREQRSPLPDLLRQQGVEVEVVGNQLTDYVIGSDCGVERKTMIDFYASIVDGRIFRQARDLISNFRYPLVILEGGKIYS